MTVVRAAALVLLGSLLGCEPGTDAEPLNCENPEPGIVELGRVDDQGVFSALADKTTLGVRLFPQGNHMLLLSVRIRNFERPLGGFWYRAFVRTGGVVVAGGEGAIRPPVDIEKATGVDERGAEALSPIGPARDGGTLTEVLPFPATFTPEPEFYDGLEAEVVYKAEDACGRWVRGVITAQLHVLPPDSEDAPTSRLTGAPSSE